MAATPYAIVFTRKAERELGALAKGNRTAANRIVKAIKALADDPRPNGVEKLKGQGGEGLYRIRAGDYRVVYAIEDARVTVEVIRVGHRREVYDLLLR